MLQGLWALQFGKGNAASGATQPPLLHRRPVRRDPGRGRPDHARTRATSSGTVPATLSLTLGTPAAFGAFTPGVTKDYTATTTANVISSAGDATLSVSDPSAFATGRLVNGTFSLAQPLKVSATSAGGGTGGAPRAASAARRPRPR